MCRRSCQVIERNYGSDVFYDMMASLQARGLDAMHKSRKEFETFVQQDIARWAPVVKSSGATGF